MKIYKFILVLGLLSIVLCPIKAQQAMNRPYVDDKLFHFGFQLGMNFSSFFVTDSELELAPDPLHPELTEVYHSRVSSILPGFHVGFVTDLRLCQYLNLRFCPGMQFTSRTLTYKTESGNPVKTVDYGDKLDILAMPVYLPLYLKWSAAREGNYRPYVIAGGGVSFNVSRDREKPVVLNLMDYFCEIGFGVDFYSSWFKFCPEITYRIGFANQLYPAEGRMELAPYNAFYTNSISRLTSSCICLTFNFE